MNTWLIIGVVALVLGPVLIGIGVRHERKGNEPPQLVQHGYLALVLGAFILLVQLFSIAAAMLVFVVISGVIWVMDRYVWAKKRTAALAPDWVEYGRSFFPVILVVFVLRSFIVEPFQIPSSSMRPGLVVGDFILVNKFAYGVRLPIINNVVVPVGSPQHGDVMVFSYPENPSISYIKRVIGLPGDTVTYKGKRLTVNGVPVKTEAAGEHLYFEQSVEPIVNQQFSETYGKHTYKTLEVPQQPEFDLSNISDFPYRENCRYADNEFTCKIPQGQYFMMGDNRDHSADSRYWGFVPEKYVIGKAFLIWLNIKQLGRTGTLIR
ncbi:MAG: signal peptidase I [Formivibrio sp.]|nr:signal peptidase I [Formivibrio sp.]